MNLRPYQADAKQAIYNSWAKGNSSVLAVLPTGAGKCLGKGTPVLMFNGSIKNVEDVIKGDKLMGPDSLPRNVVSVCSGVEQLYKVTPVKGDSYVVNESHILSLKQTGLKSKPKYPCQHGKGGVVNISVLEYLKSSNYFKHIHKGWRSGVTWGESELNSALPPYLLGMWLGDGSSRTPSVTTEDPEIVDYLYHYANSRGFNFRKEALPNNNASTYHITNNWKREGSLKEALREYGLIKNKHIPLVYKTGSGTQRLELLAGIVDSDGSLDKTGYEVTFKSKVLANDVVFVARSLGFAAYISKCEKTCTNTGSKGVYYRFHISGDVSSVPVLLDRKRAPKRKQIKNPLVTGIKVTPTEVGRYYGFEIDGDHLFMLGDFTVTHNTVLFSDIIKEHGAPSCAIAHRQELVGQISLALARDKVRHRIVGPKSVVRLIVNLHMAEVGASYYDPNAQCGVAGVDTLVRRGPELAGWLNSVTLWVQDEAHHILKDNKWGTAASMFPNAKGLGVTATPLRADGKGLGREYDGLMDDMIVGPNMRDLIDMGYLTEYRIFAPPSDIDLSDVTVSATTGDYSRDKMVKAVRKSQVVGDVVEHYLRIAKGKLGITFATDVQTATDIAEQFNSQGVPAAVVSAKTPDADRIAILRRFKHRELLQLVNVDLFGEGFDLPAIEVVSMARPTQSYGLYVQVFGRGLRILDGKTEAIIIDHVSNVVRHGLPDAPKNWTLARRDKRTSATTDDAIPVKACPQCTGVYKRIYKECPFCGFKPLPMSRSGPEEVDGDLTELDAATLATMRGEVDRVDMNPEAHRAECASKRMPQIGQMASVKRHVERQEAQEALRASIAWWGGYQRAQDRPDSESYRRFFFKFGTDVLSAQALGTKDALALAERINTHLGEMTT